MFGRHKITMFVVLIPIWLYVESFFCYLVFHAFKEMSVAVPALQIFMIALSFKRIVNDNCSVFLVVPD